MGRGNTTTPGRAGKVIFYSGLQFAHSAAKFRAARQISWPELLSTTKFAGTELNPAHLV